MGQIAVAALKAINCDTCAKYVCNACKVHSKFSNCCEFDVETEKVELSDTDSSMSVELGGCMNFHKHK